jgi:hypothetical protein
MQKNTRPAFDEQAYKTGNTATEPVTYDFHMTGPGDVQELGIEAEFEPHAPVIHAADEPDLSDDEIDEFEALLTREERRPTDLQHARLLVSNALRSAQHIADYEGADAISRDLYMALAHLDRAEGGSVNV